MPTWTTPRTWSAGELVTATMMNTHVRDNLEYLSTLGGAAINVVHYGAVGDGATDDAEAFTDAIAAAGTGGVVHVPAGVYRINSTITI